MSTARNARMDYFNGFLMLGVILGHAITALKAGSAGDVAIHTFVRTYDMPFFILISGLFLSKSVDKYVWWKNILNKAAAILIPLILWRSIFYACNVVIGFVLNGSLNISIGAFVGYLSGSWFLWAAFICAMIMICICRIFKSQGLRLGAAIAVSVLCLFIPKDIFNISFMFPFFAIGFFLEWITSKINDKALDIIKSVSVLAFIAMYCFWKGEYSVWDSPAYILGGDTVHTLLITVFRFVIGCTGCITVTFIIDFLFTRKGRVIGFINKHIVSAGSNTLVIYLFQGFALEFVFAACMEKAVEMLGYNPLVSNLNLLGFVIAPIVAFVCMMVLNIIINLMKKIPCIGKYIFGFKIIDALKKEPDTVKGSTNE